MEIDKQIVTELYEAGVNADMFAGCDFGCTASDCPFCDGRYGNRKPGEPFTDYCHNDGCPWVKFVEMMRESG